ncbi:unnamed protein product [Lupinus luteus]|uniref:ferric-chelate reductase (NADH) n=1 Tax=Lupinus luteus TaxID=3873 RepID=A0AAV1X1A1_LUPLU
MLPTNTNKLKWLPELRTKTNSTYYGIDGASFLIYTSPVLFMAALGCIYLHIAKKLNASNMERCNVPELDVAIFKRPILVKGPLGIVSGTELALLLMFIALLIWSFATYLHNGFATVTPQLAAVDGQTIWQEKFDSAAVRVALIGNICLTFLFFPVARGSSVLPFFGLTSESSIKYHIWLGNIVMTLFTVHDGEMGQNWDIKFGRRDNFDFWFLQSRNQVCLVSARVLPCEAVELNFSKAHGKLTYNPTSVMFINIPSISKLQWHPFTVTSNSNLELEKLSVVIKSGGTWTQKLYKMLSSNSTIDRLGVSVEGPYGPVSTDFLRHDTLVLISGGSGITPFISIIRELLFLKTTFKCKTPKVVLICSFRTYSSLSMIDLILPVSSTPYDISNLELQIEAYITKDKEPQSNSHIHLQTKWFKPNPTDVPIYAILGPNSWLWLGVIISSSFIIFLIIIGIIGRYYIFPIDHNSNLIFSFSLRSFLHMLIICGSIAMVASTVVLLNKKNNAKEAKRVQNLELSTPTVSPSSMIYNVDRELESLPCQSLVQSTNVHYGVRPDLRRLLFEIKGSSVKVLASGPKKMRHEVAAICSSGLAKNLHFESISFSW